MFCHSRRSLLAFGLLSTVDLSGCAVHQRLATQAVNFNLAVEKTQNEMLLLNVIRAQDRMPMYLTGMSTLTGGVQTTFSATAGGTYTRTKGSPGGVAPMQTMTDTLAHTYMPSAMASESENPAYTLTLLDNQEFMRGFMSPVGKDILAYYWSQGWPPELLVYLLVKKVELVKQVYDDKKKAYVDGPKFVLDNYPNADAADLPEMTCFGRWIRHEFLARKPEVGTVSQPENIGAPLPLSEVTNLEKLVKAASQDGLMVAKDDNGVFQLQRKQTDVRFTFAVEKNNKPLEPEKYEDDGNCKGLKDFLAPEETSGSAGNQDAGKVKDWKVDYFKELATDKTRIGMAPDSAKMKTNFVLRSPEALLYYLGELMRVANRSASPLVPSVCIQNHFHPLFIALPAGECKHTLVDADSGRDSFSIPAEADTPSEGCKNGELRFEKPRCETGRSMQAVRLLNQLMSLQKSAKDNPAPALVRVIGQ